MLAECRILNYIEISSVITESFVLPVLWKGPVSIFEFNFMCIYVAGAERLLYLLVILLIKIPISSCLIFSYMEFLDFLRPLLFLPSSSFPLHIKFIFFLL